MARKMKDSGIEWIGEIPEGWEVHRIKTHFSIISGSGFKPELQGQSTGDFPVCKASDISSSGHYLHTSANYISSDIVESQHFSIIPKGSILFAKIGEAMRKNNRSLCSLDCCVDNNCQGLVPKNISSEFSYYLFTCIDMTWFDNAGTIPCINNQKLYDCRIPFPSYDEQLLIANHLNIQCDKINEMLFHIRASIEEYKKLKQAVITQAVSKGVRGEREMEKCNIGWVKELPSDWDIIPSKFLFKNSDTKKLNGDEQLTASQQHGIITQKYYTELTGSKVVLANKGLDDWKHVEPFDFIISLRSFQGGLEMSETTGCITWHYIVLKPYHQIYSYYYKWLFKSEIYIRALQRTCNFIRDGQDLRYSNFIQVPLFEPPLEEQKEIADYLNGKCAEIDRLIAKKAQLVKELESYKKSLIYEVVTGKREV